LQDTLFTGRWLQTARVLGSLSQWLRWLATGTIDEGTSAGARSAVLR
jgi:hypothetical protein